MLATTSTEGARLFETARNELLARGYVEGDTIAFDVRWAEGRIDRISELVEELIKLEVDVLVVATTAAAIAARKLTTTIPVVMVSVGDPVRSGLVESLARPGGNITGVSQMSTDLSARRLAILRELVPTINQIAVLKNPNQLTHPALLVETEVAAQRMGLNLIVLEVSKPEDFSGAFEAASRHKADGLIALPDALTHGHRRKIIALAASAKLPAIYTSRDFVDDGGLISYGPNSQEHFRSTAVYVDKLLKGAKPGDLPIEQPVQFELAVNLRTARALGVTVPATLLVSADATVE